ncbi:MAG: 4Fe-4S dicluster domain-containing protein [Acidobacteria bacterium]|nr:4Fe-4S dicluster domain-containing protein [Acidobacteriota bacterium]
MTAFPEQLKSCGVVGAGGAGFPTYVKAQSEVEFLLANGAECEPLLHKDYELMKHSAAGIVEGAKLMRSATRARHVRFGIKEKNAAAVEAIGEHLDGAGMDTVLLGDFYPSGDEYELVQIATGRLIPPAGLPLAVGCVVNNVETLFNVARAADGHPVTHKFLSVSGAVRQPESFWAPVGTSFREVVARAGGATVPDFGFFVSGIMMGKLSFDLDDVVTKTTCGLIVLPRDHYLIVRKDRPQESMNRIGKSACDQCSYCTEFCPRYLLGYDVQPHKVMRSLGFTASGSALWNQSAELCCACGLCTLYACPEDLFPKEACDQAKGDLRAAGIRYVQKHEPRVHPMKEFRRVPLAMLRRRLKVEEYESETPYDPGEMQPASVRILLKQHAGQTASPLVKAGDRVHREQKIADVGAGELGAAIHASIDGTVRAVNDTAIEIAA